MKTNSTSRLLFLLVALETILFVGCQNDAPVVKDQRNVSTTPAPQVVPKQQESLPSREEFNNLKIGMTGEEVCNILNLGSRHIGSIKFLTKQKSQATINGRYYSGGPTSSIISEYTIIFDSNGRLLMWNLAE